MVTTLKSNDNKLDAKFSFPFPPESEDISKRSEMEIYARFMRHLRNVPNSRTEIKILSAIQFTADLLNDNDAYIAKVLVDLGLRAPRSAFPAEYLDFVDQSLLRSGMEMGGSSKAIRELRRHWDGIGEDKFTAIRRYDYATIKESFFVET